MTELLPRIRAVILEQTHILDPRVALEVQNAFCRQPQKLPNLLVAGIPQLPVVPGIFHQHLMRAHRTHAVVNPVAAPPWLAFNVIKRGRMHHGSRRPSCPTRHGRDDLSWLSRVGTKSTGRFSRLRAYRRLVPGHYPGPSNRIFAEFHALGKHSGRSHVNLHFRKQELGVP